MCKKLASILVALLLLFGPLAGVVDAQSITSSQAVTILNLTVQESLTVSASVGTVAFVASGGQYAAPSITVTTTYSLLPTRTSLVVCQILNQGTLPGLNSNYQAAVDGRSPQLFNGATGSATCDGPLGGSLGWPGPDIFDLTLTGPNNTGSHTDTTVVSTTGLSNLIPGSYSGDVQFIAQAN